VINDDQEPYLPQLKLKAAWKVTRLGVSLGFGRIQGFMARLRAEPNTLIIRVKHPKEDDEFT
jgi:hypothetical protein